jgi:putative nucleotidyltransferase with HDIG domain
MTDEKNILHRLKLRHLLFLTLLFSGIIPLSISSFLLINQNRDLLETEEKSYLTRSAEFLSVELNGFLADSRGRLEQLGDSLLSVTQDSEIEGLLRQPWLEKRALRFLTQNPQVVALRLLDVNGVGPEYASSSLAPAAHGALEDAFRAVLQSETVNYMFVPGDGTAVPTGVVAVPVGGEDGPRLVVQSVVRLVPIEALFQHEAVDEVAAFLIDDTGAVLWSEGSSVAMDLALAQTEVVRESVLLPGTQTAEYEIDLGDERRKMLARFSPVTEAGWGVVVQKPAASAFVAVREMVWKTALSTAVLVVLALVGAVVIAGRFSAPIQELTQKSHEIAMGNFGERVAVRGPGAEIGQLASDFNRMSAQVESYVDRLKRAAQQNQELFIGSMRAFVAAIDAKDPYTRGHSERVAAHSRTIARRLGLAQEMSHVIWVGALLHDVGKIGIDDRVLKKGGVLSDAEYEQMKLHPVIGAQIMSRIEQLKSMIPAIRWHHEAWNGAGYPDGLNGEQIPLMARIVAVADTFDAITTNRPYQRAYEPAFAAQRVRDLAGKRFDAKVVTAFLQAFEAGEIQLRSSSQQPAAVASTTS